MLFQEINVALPKSSIAQVVEAQRTEQHSVLLAKARVFLKERKILQPAQATLERLIMKQRQKSRQYIQHKMLNILTSKQCTVLDHLLEVEPTKISKLQQLKEPPAQPSPKALIALTNKLKLIQGFGINTLDTTWLNNNYQMTLAKYVLRCSVYRLRELKSAHRYTALVCFLKQLSLDTVDQIIEMHHKLMLKMYNRAQSQMDEAHCKQRKLFKEAQILLNTISGILLDDSVADVILRKTIFEKVDREKLENQLGASQAWLTGKFSNVFHLIIERFSYLRQFSPALVAHLNFEAKGEHAKNIVKAIGILRELNQQQKRILPDDAPITFIPKKLQPLIKNENGFNKQAWECALLTSIRDEIKFGNLTVQDSKRFGNFDDFFMPYSEWIKERPHFFKRAGLPEKPKHASAFLQERLNNSFDEYLIKEPTNTYARVEKGKWVLSVDPAEILTEEEKNSLNTLNTWLKKHMRVVKLPQLLIEVDNDLHFTDLFMISTQKGGRQVNDICSILATLMAHGCFIGPHTMAKLTKGVTYEKIRQITDWYLIEEILRSSLSLIVNAITGLEVIRSWGTGITSSSDGQRFSYSRRTLQQTYSTKFQDFALEFYTFVADNYAPFYSRPSA